MKLREVPFVVCVLFSIQTDRMDANNKTSNIYFNCESAYNYSSVKVPRNATSFIVQLLQHRNYMISQIHITAAHTMQFVRAQHWLNPGYVFGFGLTGFYLQLHNYWIHTLCNSSHTGQIEINFI